MQNLSLVHVHLELKIVLIINRSVNNTTSEYLVKLWAKRYIPDLFTVSLEEQRLALSGLIEAASPEGRAKTVAKLQRVIKVNCECAAIKTNSLFSYIPNVINLTESSKIAEFVAQIYQKILEIYNQQLPVIPAQKETAYSVSNVVNFNSAANVITNQARPLLKMPAIEQLAREFEAVLKQLREKHLSAHDPRMIGFVSTQFHFSTKLVLARLTPSEQVLLSPYFKFIEEQICIPLQRVCTAAANYDLDSPALTIVQQMLPASRDIASTVYSRAAQLYPTHHSRRGRLKDKGIKASTERDLEMFQAYLWLCFLERNMTSVEKELIPLCIMVFPSVDVTWELVRGMLQLLLDEIMERVEPNYQQLVLPYTQGMQQLFSKLN
ncbi:MAG: hypothetical protein U7123_03905 [Potamolinea sp.]